MTKNHRQPRLYGRLAAFTATVGAVTVLLQVILNILHVLNHLGL